MANEIMRLADNSVMYLWLVDRIATGYNYDMVRNLYKEAFESELSLDEFNLFYENNQDAITERYNEMRAAIYDSGAYSKMSAVADKLYDMFGEQSGSLSPKELSSLADTLRKYLETMTEFGKTRVEAKLVQNNNYTVLVGLEEDGIIKIIKPEKLKYIVDGVIDE